MELVEKENIKERLEKLINKKVFLRYIKNGGVVYVLEGDYTKKDYWCSLEWL